jgi:hypothetical protein
MSLSSANAMMRFLSSERWKEKSKPASPIEPAFSKCKAHLSMQLSAPYRAFCAGSVALSVVSAHKNAGTSSGMPAMFERDRNSLQSPCRLGRERKKWVSPRQGCRELLFLTAVCTLVLPTRNMPSATLRKTGPDPLRHDLETMNKRLKAAGAGS